MAALQASRDASEQVRLRQSRHSLAIVLLVMALLMPLLLTYVYELEPPVLVNVAHPSYMGVHTIH